MKVPYHTTKEISIRMTGKLIYAEVNFGEGRMSRCSAEHLFMLE